MTSPYDTYTSPLAQRNASPEMLRLWSPRHKFNTWRRIWLAVAEAQHELGLTASSPAATASSPTGEASSSTGEASSPTVREGLPSSPSPTQPPTTTRPGTPLVTREQVDELRAVVDRPGGITDEEMKAAERYERELRHDVMAHVHALGDSAPKARGIIHLGMTSEDVGSNADLIILAEAQRLILLKVARGVLTLAAAAEASKSVPALGFTHYQPAQPTTVGRRIAGWSHDLSLLIERLTPFTYPQHERLRGFRGATGTQASFFELLDLDAARVDEFEARAVRNLRKLIGWERKGFDAEIEKRGRKNARSAAGNPAGWVGANPTEEAFRSVHDQALNSLFPLSGQTYPRVHDAMILSDLAAIASVLHKLATDIRLLSNRKELDEPFESKQIGSSAMPYKRNPMRCERICGLSRFVMNLVGNAYDTAATQWLERTLDDSSNRRLSLPEAFLALDGALDLMHNVASGLIVHEAMVRKNLMAELPFMATENILMAAVKAGGDRQHYHELIRQHAQAAGWRVKQEGLDNDLIDRLRADPAFHPPALRQELDWEGVMDPMKYVGRSVEQTERFIREVVEPLRQQYGEAIEKLGRSEPRV